MDAAAIAALVKTQSPDHAGHTQEFIRTVKSTEAVDVIEVICSCPGRVGLTLVVEKGEPGKIVGHFKIEGGKVTNLQKKAKVDDGA